MLILCCKRTDHGRRKDWICNSLKKYFGYKRPQCSDQISVSIGHTVHPGPDGTTYSLIPHTI